MKIGKKTHSVFGYSEKNFKVGAGKDLWVSNAGNWFVGFSNIISHLVRGVLSERGKLWASKHSQSECYIYMLGLHLERG